MTPARKLSRVPEKAGRNVFILSSLGGGRGIRPPGGLAAPAVFHFAKGSVSTIHLDVRAEPRRRPIRSNAAYASLNVVGNNTDPLVIEIVLTEHLLRG